MTFSVGDSRHFLYDHFLFLPPFFSPIILVLIIIYIMWRRKAVRIVSLNDDFASLFFSSSFSSLQLH